jgi:hypothetical protein
MADIRFDLIKILLIAGFSSLLFIAIALVLCKRKAIAKCTKKIRRKNSNIKLLR